MSNKSKKPLKHSKKPDHNPRSLAALCLRDVMNGASLSRVQGQYAERLEAQQQPLFQELSMGSLRWFHQLNSCLQQLLEKPIKSKDQDIYGLMLVGAYQLRFTEKPDYAAISATVDACACFNKLWAKDFINAILRRYQREHLTLEANLQPWLSHAHPKWIYQHIEAAWPEQLDTIIAANNSRPPMCLRVNQQQSNRDHYLQTLQDANIDASACLYSAQGIRLGKACSPHTLPDFAQGICSVQDEAAQLCTQILDPQSGDSILDACAAPGGKSCHLLEHADVDLLALDIDPDRLKRVEENFQRLGLSGKTAVVDGTDLTRSLQAQQSFDRILIDAPCSGTGVIRRHPDIKILRKPTDIAKLVDTQAQLLNQCWSRLKPGGHLLYATCSILPAENAQQIEAFVQANNDVSLVPIAASWGIDTGFGRQLLPSQDGPDGFFYALLYKDATP